MMFIVRGFAGSRHHNGVPFGTLLMETTHTSEVSAFVTIEAWQARMKRPGEVIRAELLDCRPGGMLTDLHINEATQIKWSWIK